jgi:hypothetical protein
MLVKLGLSLVERNKLYSLLLGRQWKDKLPNKASHELRYANLAPAWDIQYELCYTEPLSVEEVL